ncbi:MAG: VOC family protein, partial [Acidimicrobiales bacterium]
PYLMVADAAGALAWYVDALGARRRGEVITMADGRIGHAELELAGAVVYLADESPGTGLVAPPTGSGVSVSLTLEGVDVDRTVARAVSAGAALERPAADYDYARNAVLRDPYGHRWIVSGPVAEKGGPDVTTTGDGDGIRPGDIGYVSLWVPDQERAAAFFAGVLGWSYAPADGYARQVVGRPLPHGVHGGHDHGTLFLCFAVDDIDAAVARVEDAGGTVEEVTTEPHGETAMCGDTEGTPFALYQPPDTSGASRPAVNGVRQGDLAYVTMEVQDSAAVRAFYGAVLGWTFTAGRVDDGWGPRDVMPMVGLHGGHDRTTVLPMYRIDDIHGAVTRVRGAGGTASEPETHPYGVTSLCADDQGTRFYLGQM